jgi:uncharacterized protein YjbI with pentapeptide repeats
LTTGLHLRARAAVWCIGVGDCVRFDHDYSGRESSMSEKASPSGALRACLFAALLLTLMLLTWNVQLTSRLLRDQRGISREHAFWTLCQPGSSPQERSDAFSRLVAGGNTEWRSARLSELNLESASLAGAQLDRASFQRTRLIKASLARASIVKGVFDLADLSGADLSQADLSEAHFYRADLSEAKLNRAKLIAAVMQEAKAQKTSLLVANLADSDCSMADFSNANLGGADLSGARLEGAKFPGANLSLARLNDAKIRDADFTNSNWWRARGLTSLQIESLRKNFPPRENAPTALKEDFDKWSRER